MNKVTPDQVAQMTVTERLDAIARLSPGFDELIQDCRKGGMSDLLIFDHFLASRAMQR